MFRGVNVAHTYVNAEVGAALPRFLPGRPDAHFSRLVNKNAHDLLLPPSPQSSSRVTSCAACSPPTSTMT